MRRESDYGPNNDGNDANPDDQSTADNDRRTSDDRSAGRPYYGADYSRA